MLQHLYLDNSFGIAHRMAPGFKTRLKSGIVLVKGSRIEKEPKWEEFVHRSMGISPSCAIVVDYGFIMKLS